MNTASGPQRGPRPDLDVEKALGPIQRRIDKLPAKDRALAIDAVWSALVDAQAALSTKRCAAVREMRADGMTLQQVADHMGISISRVKQLADGIKRKPRRAS